MVDRKLTNLYTHTTLGHVFFNKEAFMKMAIAVETFKHPERQSDYKVWYLNLNYKGEVIGIGVKTREELVQSLFKEYRETGRSQWRAFCQESETSKPIEIFDFIAQNSFENTHFGNLPTLAQFQETLNLLQTNLELRAIAS
jgi:hypothetical protein